MGKFLTKRQKSVFNKTLIFLTVIILSIGIFLRFVNIDEKVYSADEVRKILWLSGYSSEEFIAENFTGKIIQSKDLKQYQSPNSEKNLIDSLKVVSAKIEHVPLHHIISRFWMQLFPGNSSPKIISIIIGILSLPCFYWLCLELFESPVTGWVAVAIASVSPLHILSAQNAGSYSLWTVMILISSAALLRALRLQTKTSWFIYSLTLTLSFYSHLFSFIVAFGQAIYVFCLEGFKITKNLLNYCLAGILSLLAFSPWIVVFFLNINRLEEGTSYYNQFPASFKQVIVTLYRNIGKVFIDFYHQKGKTESLLHFLVFLLIIYSLYFVIRQTKINTWLFIITLVLITPVAHIIANFITPSALHLQFRYYLPCFVGLQLFLAYLLGSQITSISLKNWQRRSWQIIFSLIISIGIFSGLIISQSPTAALDDQKSTASGQNVAISDYLNKTENSLVISEATHSFILALLYRINDNINFQLLKPNDIEHWEKNLDLNKNYQNFDRVFLLYPDPKMIELIEKEEKFKIESITKGLSKIRS